MECNLLPSDKLLKKNPFNSSLIFFYEMSKYSFKFFIFFCFINFHFYLISFTEHDFSMYSASNIAASSIAASLSGMNWHERSNISIYDLIDKLAELSESESVSIHNSIYLNC